MTIIDIYSNATLYGKYSGVPNKHVDRLICGKPFSHRRQTYLEHFFNQKSVAWEKKWTTYAVFYLNCAGVAIL